ncbi:MAG: TolC family protein [Candidatus Cloacimonetes bacterium]|jgi:outer membrane protein TolC|nr:TolC family protein [Candidatus Cloacimonadota bacterium]MDY0337361.1 TolC family protein [Candidatus Cloacimonadaceae bacterium]MCK9334323.1 TolC family protein [Candidatus Cloacimonadota bacterium]MDD2543538.1 TolC family protein [Candidatus Cloacimonadota bacterium]MDD2682584.1 TolC family protein [Candidatus Cloacimonadota bacterium]
MKKWITIILALTGCLALAGITLDESLELAKRNNNSLLIAAEEVNKAEATYRDVRGSLLPQLNLQGGFNLNTTYLPDSATGAMPSVTDMIDADTATENENTIAGALDGIIGGLIPSSPQKEGSLAMQLKMDQVLFLGGKLINGIRAVDRFRSVQRLNYDVKEQDVILTTTQVFYQTLLAGKLVEIQEEGLATAQRHLQRVTLLSQEGQVSEFDLLRAQLEVAKLQPEVMAARNQYDLALAAFRKQIGTPDDDVIPEGEFVLPSVIEMELEEAQRLGLANRTELELLDIATQIKQIQFNAEKGNYLPNVALSASASLYTAADEYAIEADDFGTQYSVGIGFSLPIFTGLSNRSKIAYARHDLTLAKIQQRDTQELIALQIKQNHQKLHHALENYALQEQNIQMAQRNLELAQLRFENNVGIQLEVFDAQIMLSSIKLQYYNAIYEVIAAERDFTKSIGQKLIAER